MEKKLLVIKLGGAVVTDKNSKTPKARIETIKHLAERIKNLIDQNFSIILVHGAGSFAHGLVKKYNLHKGMETDKQKLIFGKVIDRMMRLNRIILKELFRSKIKAVSLAPHSFITQSAGKLNPFDTRLIEVYLKNGQIPVLFGDMVLDDKWGCSVLSGDTIVCYLGSKLKADKVIFLSDVDGIYTYDPKRNPQATLIPEITDKNIEQVLNNLTPTGRDDVTGEMRRKILEIQKSLKGVEVTIINGLKPQTLLQAANSNQVGTSLHLQ